MKIKKHSQNFAVKFDKLQQVNSLYEQRQIQVATHEEELRATREVMVKKFENKEDGDKRRGNFKQWSEFQALDRIPKLDMFNGFHKEVQSLNRLFLIQGIHGKMDDHKKY